MKEFILDQLAEVLYAISCAACMCWLLDVSFIQLALFIYGAKRCLAYFFSEMIRGSIDRFTARSHTYATAKLKAIAKELEAK